MQNIIQSLGGNLEIYDIYSTHYIVSKSRFNHFMLNKEKLEIFKLKTIHIVNIKWLVDTYFFLHKMEENNYKNIDF